MRSETRQQVRRRFDFRCGYCGVRETDVGAELTIDHFQPRIQGGSDEIANLVYCCNACNGFKSDYWQTEPDLRLLHPLRDDLTAHLVEQEDGTLAVMTPRGQNMIEVLHLNREELVAHRVERRLRIEAAEQNRLLIQRLSQLEQDVETLESRIEQLFHGSAEEVGE